MLENQLIEIKSEWLELPVGFKIFTSLEGDHRGGSVKDRMVWGELNELTSRGQLQSGDEVGEVSAGSTAISLATYCADFNLKTLLFVPDSTEKKVVENLKSLGAEVHLHPLSQIYPAFHAYCEERPRIYPFNQLYDEKKKRHYTEFGKWVAKHPSQIKEVWGAVGTGHSLAGIREGFNKVNPEATTKTIEPGSDLRIPGIRNLVRDRYGENDKCQRTNFDGTFEIFENELYPFEDIDSNLGRVTICSSFKLVLGAVKKYAKQNNADKLFLLGAAVKKMTT